VDTIKISSIISSPKMSFVSLHLSTVKMFYVSLTHTSIIYLSFAMLYLPMHILDTITPSSTTNK